MRYIIAVLVLVVLSCSRDPVTVQLSEVSNGIGRFVVSNHSARDVKSIGFEIVFQSPDGTVISVDTVSYELTKDGSTGEPVPFVKARDETFFFRPMPEPSTFASGTVLLVEYFAPPQEE